MSASLIPNPPQSEHDEMAAVQSTSDLCGKWQSSYRGILTEVQFLARFIYPRGASAVGMVITVIDGLCGGAPPAPVNLSGSATSAPTP